MSRFDTDIQLIKPTFLPAPPLLYNQMYIKTCEKFEELQGFAKKLVDKAVHTKLERLTETGNCSHFFYDALIFGNAKKALGGNLDICMMGGGNLDPTVHNFIKILLSVPVLIAYGQIENTSVGFITCPEDTSTGHMGGPMVNINY